VPDTHKTHPAQSQAPGASSKKEPPVITGIPLPHAARRQEPAPRPGVIILEWREVRKNSLLGFVRAQMPSGMILSEISINLTSGRYWAGAPSKPMVDREGVALRDDAGKIRYSPPLITFTSKELRNTWSDAIIAAMRQQHPEVFALEPARAL
jgi:hypothetical protein